VEHHDHPWLVIELIELIDRLDQSSVIKTDLEYVLHLEKYYWHAHALLMLPQSDTSQTSRALFSSQAFKPDFAKAIFGRSRWVAVPFSFKFIVPHRIWSMQHVNPLFPADFPGNILSVIRVPNRCLSGKDYVTVFGNLQAQTKFKFSTIQATIQITMVLSTLIYIKSTNARNGTVLPFGVAQRKSLRQVTSRMMTGRTMASDGHTY
jgi:hypothetical protein